MKLLVCVVFITVWVTIIAKKSKKRQHDRDNRNDTQEVQHFLDLSGTLRKSFFLFSADEPEWNTLCSPLSALLPLAKLALGAEGNSSDELLDAIGISEKSKIKEFYKSLLTRLRDLPGVKLDIASRLYVSNKVHLHHDFRVAAEEAFGSSVERIDFTVPMYAAHKINSWIFTQTNGIWEDILEQADISPSTSVILVNAICFNGRWTKPFEKVIDVTFHELTSSYNIDMMMREDEFNYTKSESLASQIISIPYSGGKASLVLVCPEAHNGLAALMATLRLKVDILAEAMLAMKPTRVKLTIPIFRVYSDLDLEKIYLEMGLKTIFNKAQSGLTKIVRDDTVYISKGKHKCFIDVNEYGTITESESPAVNMDKYSNIQPLELLVDHPFLYFIVVNGQQLFSGTYVDTTTPL